MSDLTNQEQKAVRTALRFLGLRVGAWAPLAKSLRYEMDSIQKVATGKKPVTPALALRVARFAGVSMDELLAGQWLRPGSARTAATRRTISSTRTRSPGDPTLRRTPRKHPISCGYRVG
jgi:plasmid maintenance system antidote protein VapI